MTVEHLWLFLPVALVLWRGFLQPVRLLDFWWHLKAGEVILSTHTIPRVDIFSFTALGAPSVPHCWLVQAIYYAGYSLGGLPLLIVLNTVLLVCTLVHVCRMCVAASGAVRTGVAASFIAAASLALFSGMRPHVFSFLLFAIFYWVLSEYRLQRRDSLWTLPLLMALWVNLHGAFVLGLGLVALVLGCETVRRLVHGPDAGLLGVQGLIKLAGIFAMSVLATMLNPVGYGIFGFVGDFSGSKFDFVTEWQAPRISSLGGVLLFHGPFFLTLLVLLWARKRPDLTELALVLGFAAFGLSSYRNGVWFSLVAAPIVARYLPCIGLSDCLGSLRRFSVLAAWGQKLGRLTKDTQAPPRLGLNVAIALLLLLITLIVSPWVSLRWGLRPMQAGLLEKETPVGAMDYMEAHELEGRVFHPQSYGDYLVWRLWPRQRSFFNSQVHLFGPTLFEDYAMVFLDPYWQERLKRYDISLLLLRKNAADNQRIIADARQSAEWRTLYEDELSVLFEKSAGASGGRR